MKPRIRLLVCALAICMFSGCGLSYEELYSLPRASEDYYDLQNALNSIEAEGLNYLAPASGARQEPVQLTDLDGDGVDEAVAFFRSAAGEVKIYILSQQDGVYAPAAVMDGAGTSVSSVEYADLDGSGNLELLITCQVSESVPQALQVYRYADAEATTMLTASCSRYELYDLDDDALPELLCLTGSGSDSPASLECYEYTDGELRRVGEQRLHFSYDNLRQSHWGYLEQEVNSLLLSGVSPEGQLLTDVFTLRNGELVSVSPREEILASSPVHSYYVYPEDLDGDGILEIPQTRQLPAYDSGSTAQWVIDWYRLSADGTSRKLFTTFQSFSENWYLVLLDAWTENLTIKAGDESPTVSTVTFYQTRTGATPQEILTIYTLRGVQRQTYAAEHSLTTLFSDSETVFAVTLAAAELWEGTTTVGEIAELFHCTASGGKTAATEQNG